MSLEKDINEIKKSFESCLNEKSAESLAKEIEGLEILLDSGGIQDDPDKGEKIKARIEKLRAQLAQETGEGLVYEESKASEGVVSVAAIEAKPKQAEVKKIGTETETEPATEPTTTPETPTKPHKPMTPIKPMPGIQPKPKAFNTDIELFLKKRGMRESVNEVYRYKAKATGYGANMAHEDFEIKFGSNYDLDDEEGAVTVRRKAESEARRSWGTDSVRVGEIKKIDESKHSHEKCMDCSKPPTKECLWANGHGHAWFCDEHYNAWKKGDGKGEVISVKAVKDGKAAMKFADNKNPNLMKEGVKRLIKEDLINSGLDPSMLIMAGHNPNNVRYVWYYNNADRKIVGSFKSKSHDDKEFADIVSRNKDIRGRVFEYKGKTYLIIYGLIASVRNPSDDEIRDIYLQVSREYDKPIDHVVGEDGKDLSGVLESRINEQDPLKGVHPEKREFIETGDEALNKILPQLSPEEQRYLKTVASETYQETIQKIQAATGMEVKPTNYPALVGLMIQTLQRAHELEQSHKQQLEETALDLVFSVPEFKIVEEAYLNDELGFDVKLGPGELSKLTSQEEERPEEGLTQDEELNLALADALKDTSDEDLRRRFANLLITGGSYNKLHLYNMANEKLARIDEDLPAYYGILASMAQLGYWVTPFGIEQAAAGGGETSAGSEEVIPKGDKYIIKARGTTFPYLVYELIKGIYEYLALDPSQQVAMQKDTLEDETKDMIAGPGVYKTIASYIPADKQQIFPGVQKKLTALSAQEIRDVLAKNANGQKIMNKLVDQAEMEMAQYTQAKDKYKKEIAG
jgi:hypothetical protein